MDEGRRTNETYNVDIIVRAKEQPKSKLVKYSNMIVVPTIDKPLSAHLLRCVIHLY